MAQNSTTATFPPGPVGLTRYAVRFTRITVTQISDDANLSDVAFDFMVNGIQKRYETDQLRLGETSLPMNDLAVMVNVPLNGIIKIAVSGSARNANGEETRLPSFDRVFTFAQGFGAGAQHASAENDNLAYTMKFTIESVPKPNPPPGGDGGVGGGDKDEDTTQGSGSG